MPRGSAATGNARSDGRKRRSRKKSRRWRSLFPDVSRGIQRKVSQDRVGARALYRGQRFEYHSAFVQPAVLRGGLEHRVFARDLIDEGWRAETVFHASHDVQI